MNLPIDWLPVTPNHSNPVQICIFDDGNDKYKHYSNSWIIFGRWKGKVSLFNVADENVIINSISEWKTN